MYLCRYRSEVLDCRSDSKYPQKIRRYGLFRCRFGFCQRPCAFPVVEIAFGLGIIFLVAKKRAIAGALLALFYVAIFPGNINQYVNHIDAFGLNTDNLRLIRLFFQPVLIFLALWTTGGWKYWKLWAKGKFKE